MLVSRTYPAGREGPGPGTLPFLLGAALFVLASYLVVAPLTVRPRPDADRGESKARCGRDSQGEPTEGFRARGADDTSAEGRGRESAFNVALAVILLAAYVGSIGLLGYPLSTVLFVVGHTVLVYRRNWKPGLLWGIGVAAVCYFLFSWLGVPLPKGIFLGG